MSPAARRRWGAIDVDDSVCHRIYLSLDHFAHALSRH